MMFSLSYRDKQENLDHQDTKESQGRRLGDMFKNFHPYVFHPPVPET